MCWSGSRLRSPSTGPWVHHIGGLQAQGALRCTSSSLESQLHSPCLVCCCGSRLRSPSTGRSRAAGGSWAARPTRPLRRHPQPLPRQAPAAAASLPSAETARASSQGMPSPLKLPTSWLLSLSLSFLSSSSFFLPLPLLAFFGPSAELMVH